MSDGAARAAAAEAIFDGGRRRKDCTAGKPNHAPGGVMTCVA